MKKYILEITVFVVGAVTMVVEIVGLGIIAPHFGTSLSVSSNLIGIILFGLAIGYFIGGMIADRMLDAKLLAHSIFFSGLYIGLGFLFRDFISDFFQVHIAGLVGSSVVAVAILFLPLNILFGMVLPYAIRLRTLGLDRAGETAGFLYALSVVGSVFGTLCAGFLLIPYLSISTILLVLALLLIVLALFIAPEKKVYASAIPLLLVVYLMLGRAPFQYTKATSQGSFSDGSVIIDLAKFKKIDDVFSQYSRIQVYEGIDEKTKKTLRLMRINKELHSGTLLDSDELVFKYARFNRLGGHFNPNAKKALLIGGGGYSYANYFLGDTPLFDTEKFWRLYGKYYGNNNTLSLPILMSSDPGKRAAARMLIYQSNDAPRGREIEGSKNFLVARNQQTGRTIIVDEADINDTGMPENNGFVHVHEVSKNGMPGKVISPNYYFSKPGNIIGHSNLIYGRNQNISIRLDRSAKDGEVLYVMLHRDNGNHRFDPVQVDGYEKIESLDVVEIDPKTTKLAAKYFHLNLQDPRLRIFHEDGRTFLNYTKDKYDIIYVDAFRSFYAVPFQLSTSEAAQKLYITLADNGVMIFNIPSALGGPMGKSFQAVYKTYKQVFPELRVYAVNDPTNQTMVQNIIMVGFKSKDTIRTTLNDDPEINEQLANLWKERLEQNVPILTDDFAPVDYYINTLIDIPTL